MKNWNVDSAPGGNSHHGIDWLDEQHEELQSTLDRLVVMALEKADSDELAELIVKFSAMFEAHCRDEEDHIAKWAAKHPEYGKPHKP